LSISALLQLAASTAAFILAAAAAKNWAVSPGIGKLVLTLALYTVGNLIILKLVPKAPVGVRPAEEAGATSELS